MANVASWAPTLAFVMGVVYMLGGLAKFLRQMGLVPMYRDLFYQWARVFPGGFRLDANLYRYVVGSFELACGFTLITEWLWSKYWATFGLACLNALVAYNGYRTRNLGVQIFGVVLTMLFTWLFAKI